MKQDLYTIPLKTISGKKTTLEAYRGKILLIINVASRCGFTKQYAEIEKFYREYAPKGVEVLGFPCNQFLNQEPETSCKIQAFAENRFQASFPLYEKVCVRGKNIAPIYAYLKNHIEKKPLIFIPWNFSKILISHDGRVLERFGPLTSLTHIRKKVDDLLISNG